MRDRRLQAIRLNAGIVAKIIFAIVWKVQGTFEPGIGWLILMLAVSLWVPMGFTISFVICKLVGVLALGWPAFHPAAGAGPGAARRRGRRPPDPGRRALAGPHRRP